MPSKTSYPQTSFAPLPEVFEQHPAKPAAASPLTTQKLIQELITLRHPQLAGRFTLKVSRPRRSREGILFRVERNAPLSDVPMLVKVHFYADVRRSDLLAITRRVARAIEEVTYNVTTSHALQDSGRAAEETES